MCYRKFGVRIIVILHRVRCNALEMSVTMSVIVVLLPTLSLHCDVIVGLVVGSVFLSGRKRFD